MGHAGRRDAARAAGGRRLRRRIDVVAFTSSPQIKYVFAIAERLGRARDLAVALNHSVLTAVVGRVCAASLAAQGVTARIHARKGTMGALVHAIADAIDRPAETRA